MVVLDAFFLSHTFEPVDVPDQKTVDQFLPRLSPRFELNTENPYAINQMAGPAVYMEMRHNIQFAMEKGWPIIGINDSGGARLQEGMDTLEAYGWLFRMQDLASGVVPQIALLLGPCLGGQAYHPIMQDFLIQTRDTGFMGIAGPAFARTQIGEEISLQELSGWKAHAVKSGQTHVVAEDDKDAIDKAKDLLSFFPPSNREKPPCAKTGDPPERTAEELNDIVPDEPFKPFDMKKVIKLW